MPVDFIDIPKDATSEEIKKYFEDRKKKDSWLKLKNGLMKQ